MQVSASLRLVRSGIVTSCMMSLAVGAHVAGGGSLPAWPVLVALGVLALMPVAFLARQRLSLPVMGGLLVGGQILLHQAFEMFSRPASCTPGGAHGVGDHHADAMMQCGPAISVSLSSPAPSGHLLPHLVDDGTPPIMVIGHLLAVIVMVVILARGESTFFLLIAWLRPVLGMPALVPVITSPQLPQYAEHPVAPPARRNVPVDARRGPPIGVSSTVATV